MLLLSWIFISFCVTLHSGSWTSFLFQLELPNIVLTLQIFCVSCLYDHYILKKICMQLTSILSLFILQQPCLATMHFYCHF